MSFFDRLLDPFRGKAVTIPPYDGAYKPNNALENAAAVQAVPAVDNLLLWDGKIVFSAGQSLYLLDVGVTVILSTFEAEITAMTALDEESLVIALDNGKLVFHGGARNGNVIEAPSDQPFLCPTALSKLDATTILVAQGSAVHKPSDWVVDLMSKRASGSLWKIDLQSGERIQLADKLAWPAGIYVGENKAVYVSEAFAHRIIHVQGNGAIAAVLTKIPGYPGRLAPAADGGVWLAVFAPRNRLIEFVLQEKHFRQDMLETVDRQYWIAPALSSGSSFLEPLQCGSVRTMGVHKPWAPSRSYGLAVKLNKALQPKASFHSRSDGARHGLTSIVDTGENVLVALKGAGLIVDLKTEVQA